MKKKNFTYAELNNAKAVVEELRKKLAHEIIEALTEEPKFAYEIAEETGIPSHAIATMLCQTEPYRYRAITAPGVIKKTYVRLNADGTINLEDTVNVSYTAVLYSKR